MNLRARAQRGQALSELALASIVLILLLLGIVDLARVYQYHTALQEAAREGVRYGAWFDGSSNPYLCDKAAAGCPAIANSQGGIKEVVDKVLNGAGLPASTLVTTSGCPGAAANRYNGPYTGFFPPASSTNQPWLYICYNANDPNYTGSQVASNTASEPTPPSCGTSACGGFDMEVVVLMNFALVVQSGPFGPSLPVAANAHMRVQGGG